MGLDHPAVVTLLALAAVSTALATVWKVVIRPTLVLAKRMGEFLDDWNGQPARPGRAAIKPMPERMATLEGALNVLREDVVAFQEESTRDRADLRSRLPPHPHQAD